MLFAKKSLDIPDVDHALKGRPDPIPTAAEHFINSHSLKGPYPDGYEIADFAMGCYWGVERIFWQVPGVWVTAVGNEGGATPNPTYEEVCSGRTGHAETVRVVFDPNAVSYEQLLKVFWENHNPTQGMRQGHDVGTQYRSAIFTHGDTQAKAAAASKVVFEMALRLKGFGAVTTDIEPARTFYFAEGYHQQYLAKNPSGYCGIGGTGVVCPIGMGVSA